MHFHSNQLHLTPVPVKAQSNSPTPKSQITRPSQGHVVAQFYRHNVSHEAKPVDRTSLMSRTSLVGGTPLQNPIRVDVPPKQGRDFWTVDLEQGIHIPNVF